MQAQEPASPALSCRHATIEGHVERGETFTSWFGPDLALRVVPEVSDQNPPGWTIRVTPASDATSDYAMVVTPPYRFNNPRYVSTAYSVSAEEALSHSPRDFSFVVSEQDFQRAREALEAVLWPANFSDAEVAAAEVELGAIQTFQGRFWIERGTTSEPTSASPQGAIEWMMFRAELCLP